MPRKVHAHPGDKKADKSLRTAVMVTVIAGVTLVLLSTAVFSLASTTRSLSRDAERLHTADESLRAATTARAQLALGLHGARVDSRIGSDSSLSVSASVNEANMALDGFEQAISLLDNTALDAPSAEFLNSARESADSIRVPTTESERDRIDEALDASYSALIEDLTEERERLLASVVEADRRMGTLGNLASFVVAFLLPTSAIFIYRQLARRPRRQVELEHELELQRRTERKRAESLRLGLTNFDEKIASGTSTAVVAEAERLSAMNALTYNQLSYEVARVPLDEVLQGIADQLENEVSFEASADHFSVLVDERALRLALGTIVDSAYGRGATRVHLADREGPASGKIDVLSDATVIAPLEIRKAFLDTTELTDADTQSLRSLILARTLLEGMGARIDYQASSEYEKFEITVPRAARSAVPAVTAERTSAPTSPAPPEPASL